jgi:sulfate permease, SulP family
VIFDTLPGLVIGMAISLILLVYRVSRPRVTTLARAADGTWVDTTRHPDARPATGIAVLRPEGGIFFANADQVRHQLLAAAGATGTRALVLDAEAVPYVDVTAATMLADLDRDLRRQGVELHVAHNLGQVRDVLRRAGVALPQVHPTVEAAVHAARRPSSER